MGATRKNKAGAAVDVQPAAREWTNDANPIVDDRPGAPSLRDALEAKGLESSTPRKRHRRATSRASASKRYIYWSADEERQVEAAYVAAGDGDRTLKRFAPRIKTAMETLAAGRRRPITSALRKWTRVRLAQPAPDVTAPPAGEGVSFPLHLFPDRPTPSRKSTAIAKRTNGNGTHDSARAAPLPPLPSSSEQARLVIAHELIRAVTALLK